MKKIQIRKFIAFPFIYFICLALISCASNDIVKGNGIIKEEKGWLNPGVKASVIFVKVVNSNGKWELLDADYKRMPINPEAGEERLYINTKNNYVMPDYEHYAYRRGTDRIIDCSDSLARQRSGKYNPCGSKFTKNYGFGDGWFGWLKLVNTDEIIKASKDTDLLVNAKAKLESTISARKVANAELIKCNVELDKVEEKLTTVPLKPKFTDKTRFYVIADNSILTTSIKLKRPQGACPESIDNLTVEYKILPNNQIGRFALAEQSAKEWREEQGAYVKTRRYAEAPGDLSPEIYMLEQTIAKYNINNAYSDDNIIVRWGNIYFDDKRLTFNYSLENGADKHAKINSISFYLDEVVITVNLDTELPPHTTTNNLISDFPLFSLDVAKRDRIYNLQHVKNDRQAAFGVSVSYSLNDAKKTLYKVNSHKLSSFVE